jgi:hypothetical protein
MKNDTSRDGASITLDPRTEELLREIAADKDSCLLRAPRRELEHALVRSDYHGVETTVGFSAAERELLRTARAEVAYWLNVVCFRRLTEDAETRRYCTRLTDGDREFDSPPQGELSHRVRDARASALLPDAELTSAAELISAVVSRTDGAGGPSNVLALAGASLRLHPTFQARHYAIQASQEASQRVVTLARAELLARTSTQRLQRAYAEALQAVSHWLDGRSSVAHSLYLSGSEAVPTFGEFRLRALVMAVLAGQRIEAGRLAREIDNVGIGDAAVRVVTESIRERNGPNRAQAVPLARSLLGSAGPVSRSLLHELATT